VRRKGRTGGGKEKVEHEEKLMKIKFKVLVHSHRDTQFNDLNWMLSSACTESVLSIWFVMSNIL